MSRRSAFTLIELLVVIAIIAILAAILFPVFAQAKMAAKKTAGLSGIKQIALGTMMYQSDYDDTFARGSYPANPAEPDRYWYTWREITIPYIKSGVDTNTADTWTNGRVTARGGIWRLPGEPGDSKHGITAHGVIFPEALYRYWAGSQHDEAPYGTNPPRASTSATYLNQPSRIIIHSSQGVNPDWGNTGANTMEPDWWFHGGQVWPPQFTGPNSGAKNDNDRGPCDWDTNTACAMPRYRYNETGVFAFADGSAKTIKKGAMNWCVNMYVGKSHFAPSHSGDNWAWLYDTSWNAPCSAFASVLN